MGLLVILHAAWLLAAPVAPPQADMHAPFDRILDTYVRDGLVYYRALKTERAGLDRYIASLNVPEPQVAAWPREAQQAFWINAYNALVLRTVIDAYPIRGKSAEYPAGSIRQISGAFEGIRHRVGGASLTLDDIETKILAGFGDARLILALGRGARGSPRLRSEAFRAATLERQLTDVVRECATRAVCTRVDRAADALEVNPLVGWREELFIKTFTTGGEMWANRAPIERAVAAMVYPHLFPGEREMLALNTFRVRYSPFDWSLNDLGSLMDLELAEKVAIVTGASRGLGLASARALAEEGCKVVICSRGSATLGKAEIALDLVAGRKDAVLGIEADVSTAEGARKVVTEAVTRFGQIDILVNNIGKAGGGDIVTTLDAEWQGAIDQTLFPAIRMSRLVVPHMRRSGGGVILIIASIWGRESGGRMTYNAVKAAEISLAKAMAQQLARDNIRVNSVAPGSILFEGGSWWKRQQEDPEEIARFVRAELPFGRFGTPEEVAATVAFLASPRASWISGACVTVDGCQSRSNI
jgi:3-oxoacyl-[acyl-carrier protein] reductase